MKEKYPKLKFSSVKIIVLTIILLSFIVLSTKYYGSTDTGDYLDTAKFFTGNFQAKLRSSHSIVYGLMHYPFVKLTNSFIIFKITSLLWLFLLILSVYYISDKNKKTLLLFVTAPILWYMGPWASPIQLSSLLFLWGYFFIVKFNEKENLKHLIYSSLLIGLAWAFWDAIIYFAIILAFCFLYNKKTFFFIVFFTFLFIGTLPKLIIDQIFFGFAFFSIFKHLFAEIVSISYGSIYGQENLLSSSIIIDKIIILLVIPFFSYLMYKKQNFIKNKKTIIFLTLSIPFIFLNAQIRFFFLFAPILILIIGEILNKKQIIIQILIFFVIGILVINPYLWQIKYETNAEEFSSLIKNFPNIQMNSSLTKDIILQDLESLSKEYSNQTFIVGNKPDSFQHLADVYWGKNIQEFISIQDYNLFINNQTALASKTICSNSKEWNRRDICMSIELRKAIADKTDYKNIQFGIGIEEPIKLENFKLIKKYNIIYLSKKID